MRWIRKLRHDVRGAISVELALTATFVLIPMTLATWDMAELLRVHSMVNQTVQAAFYYAWGNSGSVTTANVQSTALAAYGGTNWKPTISATITAYCITPSTGYPSSGTPPTPVSGSCGSGTTLETYLSVTSTSSVTNLFLLSYIANPFNVTATSVGRIK